MSARTMIVTSFCTVNHMADTLLDAMMIANEDFGNVTWTRLTPNWAAGFIGNDPGSRIAVIDVDTADGPDVVGVTVWAAQPEIDFDLPD